MKALAVKAEYIDPGTSEYITVQQIMTDFILASGTRFRAKNDIDILKVFLQALVRTNKHSNLKKTFREILGIEVSPTQLKMTLDILDATTQGTK